MNKLLTIFCLLLTSTAYGDEAFLGYGVGLFHSAEYAVAETKVVNLGYRKELYRGIYWQFKGGFWGDGSGDPTRSYSGYVSSGPGILIDLQPVEFRTGWGLAAISNPDGYLGGRFPQFNGEVYGGLRDNRGNGIGFKYEHISSAGLISPNVGRDFLILELSQKW